MQTVTVVGCAIIVGMAMITDPSGTTSLVITVITTRGFAWIIKKIIGSLNKDASDIIDFAGWSIAGVAMVKILKNAKVGIEPVLGTIGKFGDAVKGLGTILDKILEFADKVTFWS